MSTDRAPSAARDLMLAAVAAACFGTTIMLNRFIATRGVESGTALGGRFGIAGVLLLLLLRATGRPLLPPKGERLACAVLGLGFYTFESTCFFLALQRGTAAAVALLFYMYPAVVIVVELLLRTVVLRASVAAAVALAIGGGVIVAVGGGRVVISPAGVLCVLGSIALFSSYVIGSDRWLVRTDAATAAAWTALGAATGVVVTGPVLGTLSRADWKATAAIAGNGVATAVAFAFFFMVLGRLGASRTAITMALEAVFGIVLSAVFLGESVRPIVALGGVAILTGAVLAATSTPESLEAREPASAP